MIDVVWREAQFRPFLLGGRNCARLVTMRLPQVLRTRHIPTVIDAMQDAEGLRLIAANLPDADNPASRVPLAALVNWLGNWAQILGIANGGVSLHRLSMWIDPGVERRSATLSASYGPHRLAREFLRTLATYAYRASLRKLDDWR